MPKWINFLERRMSWLAVPNIAVLLVTLQAFGFIFVAMNPIWIARLALIPEAVQGGEYWRLITFLALPLSLSPLWMFFTLWFLYFVINAIEKELGAFKATLYILISVLLMVGFSFAFNYPITQIAGFESTLFLAAAALFPEMQVQLFLVIPVKMKWMAWFTMATVLFNIITGGWLDRLYLVTLYANYLIFFGPAHVYQAKQAYRKWDYQRKTRL
jgi:hypothetical protein